MHFRREGTGTPLLLIHGLSQLHTWDPIFADLARERDVIAVDLPGFGNSPPLPGRLTMAALTDAVEEFIAGHGLGDVDVVGSSMGGRIALELARRGHGGTAIALDPVGFWTDLQAKLFGATVGGSLRLIRAMDPILPQLVRTAAGRTALLVQFSAAPWRLDPDLVLTELRSLKRSPSLDAAVHELVHGPAQPGAPAGSLNGSVVISWGANDRVTPPSQAQRAHRLFPDASLHWFDECGHFPHWDQPDETVRLILDATRQQ